MADFRSYCGSELNSQVLDNRATEAQPQNTRKSTTWAVGVYRRWAARRQQHDYIKADLLEYNDDLESLNKALFKLYNEAHTYYWKGGLHTQPALGVCGQVLRSVIGLFQRDGTYFAHVCYLSIYAQTYTYICHFTACWSWIKSSAANAIVWISAAVVSRVVWVSWCELSRLVSLYNMRAVCRSLCNCIGTSPRHHWRKSSSVKCGGKWNFMIGEFTPSLKAKSI